MTSPTISRSSSGVSLHDLSQAPSSKSPTGEPAKQPPPARGKPAGMPDSKPMRSERRSSEDAPGSSAIGSSQGPRSQSPRRGMPPLGTGVANTDSQAALTLRAEQATDSAALTSDAPKGKGTQDVEQPGNKGTTTSESASHKSPLGDKFKSRETNPAETSAEGKGLEMVLYQKPGQPSGRAMGLSQQSSSQDTSSPGGAPPGNTTGDNAIGDIGHQNNLAERSGLEVALSPQSSRQDTNAPGGAPPDAAQGDPHWLRDPALAHLCEFGRQLLTCGIPTGLREGVFLGTCSTLAPELLRKGNVVFPAVITAQGLIAIMDLVVQLKVRQPRLNRPNVDAGAAVHGYHGKTVAQLNETPETRRQDLRKEQGRGSHAVTALGVVGNVTFMAASAASYASGKDNGNMAVACLATQLRNLTYLLREPAQASIRATGPANGAQMPGVNGRDMRLMAGIYLATNLAIGGAAQAYAVKGALGRDAQSILGGVITGGVITDQQGAALTGKALLGAIVLVAAIRAICNTVIEWSDTSLGSHLQARRAGTTLKPNLGLPLQDYGRMKDHAPARLAWNNFATSLPILVRFLPIDDDKKLIAAFTAVAALFALSYLPVNKTYQAHAEVRRAAANANEHATPPEGEDRV